MHTESDEACPFKEDIKDGQTEYGACFTHNYLQDIGELRFEEKGTSKGEYHHFYL